MEAFQSARTEAGQRLLVEPLSHWERRRPYKRAMLAIENYDRSLEELVRTMPEYINASGAQALELLGGLVAKGLARRVAGWRRKVHLMPFRAVLAEEIQRQTRRRTKVEGGYLLVLAQALHQFRRNWEVCRCRAVLDTVAQGGSSPELEAEALEREASRCTEFAKQSEKALEQLRKLEQGERRRLAKSILDCAVFRPKVKSSAHDRKRAALYVLENERLNNSR